MGKIILIFSAFIVAVTMCFSSVQNVSAGELDSLVDEALNNNLNIKAAFNQWKAEEHKIKQAKTLPYPVASYTYFGEEIQTRVGPQEEKYGLSQKVPFPGKLHLKGMVQENTAYYAGQKYETVKRNAIRDIKHIYFDLFFCDKSIDIAREEEDILKSLEKVARKKYESNTASQQDVIQAQLELSRISNRFYYLEQARGSLNARLNSLLVRPDSSVMHKISEIEESGIKFSMQELIDIAYDNNQELLGAEANVQKAGYEKRLARMEYLPDFTLSGEYIDIGNGTTSSYNDGQDAWMTKISVSLPLWQFSLKEHLDEKDAVLIASQRSREDMKRFIEYKVQDIYFQIEAYKNIIQLHKTSLVPQSEQAFDAARIAYESGEMDFLNWLEAKRTFLQTRLAYYKTIVDYHKAIADLEQVVGVQL